MIQTQTSETICAIATASGGAIGIIRISGPKAIVYVESLFKPLHGKNISERKTHTLSFGEIYTQKGDLIDEVLVAVFRTPHSYTGEESVEIFCHGSSYILQTVMEQLVLQGCKTAQPGEFTQRAFLNGKMDLSQAEAVADLIASSSAATHKLAMSQMRGGFSLELKMLREQLLHLTSLLELELDFSDHEDLEFADRTQLQRITKEVQQAISKLINSFHVGNVIKNGIPVAIIGETNAGKSTLLNALLQEEKAIVSNIHGTTRDIIEDTINIQGITFRFIDTAGIRETTDEIETLGIERSFQAIEKAQIVLWVHDSTQALSTLEAFHQKITPFLKEQSIILVRNKSDLISSIPQFNLPLSVAHHITISAKSKVNISDLQQLLVETASLPTTTQEDIIVTNVRHVEALSQALSAIIRVQNGLLTNISGDLISQDLRECIFHLSDIIGDVTTDQVLGSIFERFCIGK